MSAVDVLEMRGVTKRFGGVVALEEVDFSARAGEIHALLGENGAGKSTLMQLASGLYRMEAGQIRVSGRPVPIASPRDAADAGIRMVYQHFTLVERFTVAENLALTAPESDRRERAYRSYDPRQAAAPALETAARLGWRLNPDVPAGQLPVGAQQRLEIIKALQGEARVLIFDEPTAVLAPGEVEELFRVLRRLRDEGRAIVFISHKLPEVIGLCDRVTVLRRGRRIATLSIAETSPRELAELMVGPSDQDRSAPAQSSGRYMEGNGETRRHGDTENETPSLSPCHSLRASVPPCSILSPNPVPGTQHPAPRLRGALVLESVVVQGQGRRAVDGVSLELRQGEIFGLAGVDGNGQVELAEAIWGTRPVAGGAISLDGRTLAAAGSPPRPVPLSPRRPVAPSPRRLGYIPQDRRRTGLVLEMSVRENLVLTLVDQPAYRRGPFLRWRALRALADRLVAQFDIRVADPGQPAASLSGGNQQKIVIARALFGEPDVLIAVNPTRGLDFGATEYVHQQLRQARDRGAAVLLISTELDEVTALSDRVGVLYEGRLMDVVPPDTPREEIGLLMGGKTRAEASA